MLLGPSRRDPSRSARRLLAAVWLSALTISLAGPLAPRLVAQDPGGSPATDATFVDNGLTVTVLQAPPPLELSGAMAVWHPVTLEFTGLATHELASPNPFLDQRFEMIFTHVGTGTVHIVPGYYAADGNAAESGASSGDVWRVHFTPELAGSWMYEAVFVTASGITLAESLAGAVPAAFHGAQGQFDVQPPDASAPGFHGSGPVIWTGESVLRLAGSGVPFLEGGANSPENLLAYADFDQTPPSHTWAPHVGDWQPGDPTWRNGLGKGLIGALRYLADKGMNAVYFLTYNVGGDGKDVWPFTSPSDRYHYDCSKLDQWNIVFDHMDRMGLALHIVLQEQENDNGAYGLDGGELGVERRLYHRELIARFGHHLGVFWNLGEENTNTGTQREAFYLHITALDTYDHPVLVHTFPEQKGQVYVPLLLDGLMEAASLQDFELEDIHASTIEWRKKSVLAGRPWAIFSHEFGPSTDGVVPDSVDYWHKDVRSGALWGNFMGGGTGVEWYFGKAWPDNDLTCEDWRSRDHMWDLTRFALGFFRSYVPVDRTLPDDTLVDAPGAMCLAEVGEVYAVYLPDGGLTSLDLEPGIYRVDWFDPRFGGSLQTGDTPVVTGPGWQSLGLPPHAPARDWAVLVSAIKGDVLTEHQQDPTDP